MSETTTEYVKATPGVSHLEMIKSLRQTRYKPSPTAKTQKISLATKIAMLKDYPLDQGDADGETLLIKATKTLVKEHHIPLLQVLIDRSDPRLIFGTSLRNAHEVILDYYLKSRILHRMAPLLIHLARKVPLFFRLDSIERFVEIFTKCTHSSQEDLHKYVGVLLDQFETKRQEYEKIKEEGKPNIWHFAPSHLVKILESKRGLQPGKTPLLLRCVALVPDLNQKTRAGKTILGTLCENVEYHQWSSALPIWEAVLERSDPTILHCGKTPLMWFCRSSKRAACDPGLIPFLEKLLAGSDPNLSDRDRTIPLMHLIEQIGQIQPPYYPREREELFPFLLSLIRVSNLRKVDIEGKSALRYAIYWSRQRTWISVLLPLIAGSDLSQQAKIRECSKFSKSIAPNYRCFHYPPPQETFLQMAHRCWTETPLEPMIGYLIRTMSLDQLLAHPVVKVFPHFHTLNQQIRAYLPGLEERLESWVATPPTPGETASIPTFLEWMGVDLTLVLTEITKDEAKDPSGEETKKDTDVDADTGIKLEIIPIEKLPTPGQDELEEIFAEETRLYFEFRTRFRELWKWMQCWRGKMAPEFWPLLCSHLLAEHLDPLQGFLIGMENLGWAPGFWESEKLARSRPEFRKEADKALADELLLGQQASILIGKLEPTS